MTVAIGKGLQKNAKILAVEKFDTLDAHLDDLIKKGEIDEVGKVRVKDELYRVLEESSGYSSYSARFAKTVKKSSDNVSSKIKNYEKKIKNKTHEHGKIVNESEKVDITHTEKKYVDKIDWSHISLSKFIKSVVTHNHPKGTGLSLTDAKMFLLAELEELRAVIPDASVYRLKNIKLDLDKRKELSKFIKDQTELVNEEYPTVDKYFKEAIVFGKLWEDMKNSVEYVKYIN